MTARALKERIVQEAREIRTSYGVPEDAPGACLYDACAVIRAAAKHEVQLTLQAGSAYWQAENVPPPGEIHLLRFGYEWEPDSPMTKLRLSQNLLPEMHVWAGDPATHEIVDITTKYWPAQCARLLKERWTAEPPPDFLWSHDLPEGTSYVATRDATLVAYEFAKKVCTPGGARANPYDEDGQFIPTPGEMSDRWYWDEELGTYRLKRMDYDAPEEVEAVVEEEVPAWLQASRALLRGTLGYELSPEGDPSFVDIGTELEGPPTPARRDRQAAIHQQRLQARLAELQQETDPGAQAEQRRIENQIRQDAFTAELEEDAARAERTRHTVERDPELETYTLPSYWASYLINGDGSGLEPGEQETIDEYFIDEQERAGRWLDVYDTVGEEYFSHSNDATNMGSDVVDYVVRIHGEYTSENAHTDRLEVAQRREAELFAHAIASFELITADHEIEEDQEHAFEDVDPEAYNKLRSAFVEVLERVPASDDELKSLPGTFYSALDEKAFQEVKTRFQLERLSDAGSTNDTVPNLIAQIPIMDMQELIKLYTNVSAEHGGGDDIVYLDTPYMEAAQFEFFPEGYNGPRYTLGANVGEEDIWEWITEHASPYDVMIGDKVRSFNHENRDVEGPRASYIEGKVLDFKLWRDGTTRYAIRVDRDVSRGVEVAFQAAEVFPPMNGTPTSLGRATYGVVVIQRGY
jgi:hypothetical protein